MIIIVLDEGNQSSVWQSPCDGHAEVYGAYIDLTVLILVRA